MQYAYFGRKGSIVECYIVYRVIGNDATNVVFGFLYNTKSPRYKRCK